MEVHGINFTSRPGRTKPITWLHCILENQTLTAGKLKTFPDFPSFETALKQKGPWIAGFDFPFGQSRKFIREIGWPENWEAFVRHAASLGRAGFRDAMDA
ncbi:hypothetical protein C8N32_105110 [Rhodovulum imhoffii]|uniref:DUF429 domain-containing protein n=1 Tax=Rhodovulum imhoffii TaxID=365340 RepID=A0A2T5BTH7_9RHOB|nr:hypothetical protein C8N32_105110 [Rhodovulum imhoffii]